MQYFIVISLFLATIGNLHAQSGWRDMGGYRESVDTTGAIFQYKATPNGKYLYTITRLGVKNALTIQKWDIDSGVILMSREIDMQLHSQVYCINLNCDAATYSMHAALAATPSVYRLIVRSLDTDSLIAMRTDETQNSYQLNKVVVQIDFDSTSRSFYIAYNSNSYESGGGPNYKLESNGNIKKKTLSGDTMIVQTMFTPNTVQFYHKCGTSVLSALTSYRLNKSGFVTASTNSLKYRGVNDSSIGINLATYDQNSTTMTLSPDGKKVYALNGTSIMGWYIDSTNQPLSTPTVPLYPSCYTFSDDSKYLLINSPQDSTLYTINPAMQAMTGSIKHPIFGRCTQLITTPDPTKTIAVCSDNRLRILNAQRDTTAPVYSFNVNKKRIYQFDTVSCTAIVPSFDNCIISWNFGDSTSAVGIAPLHVYKKPGFYDVSIQVQDKQGNHSTIQQKLIEVLPRNLVVDFETDKNYGTAPLTIQFKNMSSGPILSYKWDFGDGTISHSKDTIHTFNVQRSYTVTLTVNDGIKDTSITKIHYINADDYPPFLLKTKRTASLNGYYYRYDSLRYDYSRVRNIFENVFRSRDNTVYLKSTSFNENGYSSAGTLYDLCGPEVGIYRVQPDGTIGKALISLKSSAALTSGNICDWGNGSAGIIGRNQLALFSQFYIVPSSSSLFIVSHDTIAEQKKFPIFSYFFTVRPLKNNVDCYVFRSDRTLTSTTSAICFYADTVTLLNKYSVYGYALPPIETPDNSKVMTVVSPVFKDSLSARWLQLRWYSPSGIFLDSLTIATNEFECILDIAPLPNNKFMLCGFTAKSDVVNQRFVYTYKGLLLIMDERGTIEYRRQLPQWYSFRNITSMNNQTFAVTGSAVVANPGFIAVKSDGKIVGDFRADFTQNATTSSIPYGCPTCKNVTFGKTMNDVIFTRNVGYNAELYTSTNPYLKDISVSVDELPAKDIPLKNTLNVSPNPTDGLCTISYYSTSMQVLTLTITSLLGEVIEKQSIEVDPGENSIPLDLSRFTTGVAFIRVAGRSEVLHAQICVVR